MVWPSQVLSHNRAAASNKKETNSKSANRATLKIESTNGEGVRHGAKGGTRSFRSTKWHSLVLDDARKLTKYHQRKKIPKDKATDNETRVSGKAWPSDVLDVEKYSRRIERQHSVNPDPSQANLWPSLVLEDKTRNKCNYSVREERNESSTRSREQNEERDGMINERYTSNRRPQQRNRVRSLSSDQVSFATPYSNEEYEDDETRSYGSTTYDSHSIGTSTLTSTLRTGSIDTRNLDTGGCCQQRQHNASSFHPSVPTRDAKSNNLVAALFHITTNCYAPADPDIPY
ncbi:MAG: hypothetical protein SGBAC_003488 [Bacillariaceae sp.]